MAAKLQEINETAKCPCTKLVDLCKIFCLIKKMKYKMAK